MKKSRAAIGCAAIILYFVLMTLLAIFVYCALRMAVTEGINASQLIIKEKAP